MLPKNVLYYGLEDGLPECIALRAGPLSLVFEAGDLRYIRLGGREVLRRVYVAVRDRNWGTVPGAMSNLSVRQGDGAFEIRYDSDHRQDEIHFRWTASITGTADGVVTWTMEGKALSTFLRNRIGICVLHPIRECAGQPCAVETVDGRIEKGVFPRLVSPQQPFVGMRAISHEAAPGVTAEVRFSGDVFEMEDQRNWTDASYKTYSTPLALPFPAEVTAGTAVSQTMRLSLRGTAAAGAARVSGAVEFRAGATRRPLPRIGLAVASHGVPLDARQIARLKTLRLAHLRAELHLGGSEHDMLVRAKHEADALGVPLEAAVFLTDAGDRELAALAARVRQEKWNVCRWLVMQPKWIAAARKHVGAVPPGAPLVCGTNAYFAELNRQRPDAAAIDGGCFSLNPQVHAFDNASLVENVAAQAYAVESAREFLGGKPVSVTTVTLKPRFNPDATAAGRSPAKGELPAEVDPRQMSLFGAGWTLGSLKYVSEAGAASVTWYETTGWRGVMELEGGPPLPARFRSLAGAVFPLYHVLADAGEFAGGEVIVSEASEPLIADGIILSKDGRTRVLISNYSERPQRISVDAAMLGRRCRLKRLDESNAEEAMKSPEQFRSEPGQSLDARNGRLELDLAPFALARLDSTGSDL